MSRAEVEVGQDIILKFNKYIFIMNTRYDLI